MNNSSAIVILAVVAFAVWWWLGRSRGTPGQAEAQLLRICFGDEGQVERLINGEMARGSGISRAEAAGRAVQRHRRDNR